MENQKVTKWNGLTLVKVKATGLLYKTVNYRLFTDLETKHFLAKHLWPYDTRTFLYSVFNKFKGITKNFNILVCLKIDIF